MRPRVSSLSRYGRTSRCSTRAARSRPPCTRRMHASVRAARAGRTQAAPQVLACITSALGLACALGPRCALGLRRMQGPGRRDRVGVCLNPNPRVKPNA